MKQIRRVITMKRVLAILLASILLLAGLNAVAEGDSYADAVRNLNLYMANPKDSGLDITNIINDLRMVNNKGYGSELFMYATMVQLTIEENKLTEAMQYVEILELMPAFVSYLEENDGLLAYMQEKCGISDDKISIVPVSQVRAYIEGREAMEKGDLEAARTLLAKCLGFHNARELLQGILAQASTAARERVLKEAMSCYANKDMEKAIELLKTIMDDYPTAKALYDLVSAEMHGSTPAPAPEITAPPASPAPAAPQEEATDAPAPAASDWVSEVPAGSTIIEKKTQYRSRNKITEYRYRTLETKTSTSKLGSDWALIGSEKVYGAWSDYSETPVSSAENREVESKTSDVSKQVDIWKYSRWDYEHVDHPGVRWYSCVDVREQKPSVVKTVYGWSSTTSETRFASAGRSGGCSGYKDAKGKTWYNETKDTKTVTEQVTKYRSRSITTQYSYQRWSAWSDWSNDKTSESSTRQVEIRTENGSWSSWRDKKTSGDDVQTRTLYRYLIQ